MDASNPKAMDASPRGLTQPRNRRSARSMLVRASESTTGTVRATTTARTAKTTIAQSVPSWRVWLMTCPKGNQTSRPSRTPVSSTRWRASWGSSFAARRNSSPATNAATNPLPFSPTATR